ncbi:hypothetical protein KAW64_04650, partial [bacterium]|nr:hypothetical protein [bacterium]
MAKTLGVIVIHGMGSPGVGFAEKMITEINSYVEAKHRGDAKKIAWQPIHWANEIEQRELDYMRDATRENDFDWIRVRKFVVTAFGDAVAYQQRADREDSVYNKVHKTVAEGIVRLRKALCPSGELCKAPLIFLAHSLGGVIMSDYIWDTQKAQREPGNA